MTTGIGLILAFLSCLSGSELVYDRRIRDIGFLSCLSGSELVTEAPQVHRVFSELPIRQ